MIREDPERTGLLYAGTETGLYVSFDDGGHWQRFQGNLPVVPIHDLVVKDSDLILATHGRSFWVLDDLTPLRTVQTGDGTDATLFPLRPTVRFATIRGFGGGAGKGNNYQGVAASLVTFQMVGGADGDKTQKLMDAGENPPDGVIVHYFLPNGMDNDVTLTFTDASGKEIRSFSSEKGESGKVKTVPAKAGINRFVWDMRYPDAVNVEGAIFRSGGITGPIAPPGQYMAKLTIGDKSMTQPFEILKDPRVPATQQDFDAQFELLRKIQETLSNAHSGVNQIRDIRSQVEAWEKRSADRDDAVPVHEAAEAIKESLNEIEGGLIESRLQVSKDPLHYPLKLNNQLTALASNVASADAAPTKQEYEVFEVLAAKADKQLEALRTLIENDLSRFNRLVQETPMPPVG